MPIGRQFRPDAANLRQPILRIGQQLKGRAAMPVSIERQPISRGLIGVASNDSRRDWRAFTP